MLRPKMLRPKYGISLAPMRAAVQLKFFQHRIKTVPYPAFIEFFEIFGMINDGTADLTVPSFCIFTQKWF